VVRICGAGFEEHCSGVSGDVLDSVFCCSGGATYDVITLLICIIQKRKYLWNEGGYFREGGAVLLYFEKPFRWAGIVFCFIGTSRHLVNVLQSQTKKLGHKASSSLPHLQC